MEQAKKFLCDEITFIRSASKTQVMESINEALRQMNKKRMQKDRDRKRARQERHAFPVFGMRRKKRKSKTSKKKRKRPRRRRGRGRGRRGRRGRGIISGLRICGLSRIQMDSAIRAFLPGARLFPDVTTGPRRRAV
jgi:hypothetical protein